MDGVRTCTASSRWTHPMLLARVGAGLRARSTFAVTRCGSKRNAYVVIDRCRHRLRISVIVEAVNLFDSERKESTFMFEYK